jgi:hypothetical protein
MQIRVTACSTNTIHIYLKVASSEKVGGSGVTSTLGILYWGVVMGVLLSFDEAAILYGAFNIAPPIKAKYNSICT